MWKQLPLTIPADQELVWIRLQRWAGASFLAEWDASSQSFKDRTNEQIYPIYAVSYWKSQ